HGYDLFVAGPPDDALEFDDLRVLLERPKIAISDHSSSGSSRSDLMTGTRWSRATAGAAVSPRFNRIAPMPTASAPSTSWRTLSPTITASAAGTSSSESAARKILGCGFISP